jgi:DNA-directed RNA polymerase I, II, and III subunit RPABC2|tara:strand:- start:577 stop:939 length:363 start_codon:yes stop_codon:yes gene_type:complete
MDELDEINYDSENEYDIDYTSSIKETLDIEDIEQFKLHYKPSTNITNSYLTVYEKTRILCERTQQIEDGSIPYIPNIERFTNAYSIAVEELKLKKIPFIIRRPLPNLKGYEYWKLSDMNY